MALNRRTGFYEGIIPGGFMIPGSDQMYFIETADYPDIEKETPCVIIELTR